MSKIVKIDNVHPECKHQWALRAKKHYQSSERFCTNCGDSDIITDDDFLDEITLKKIHGKQ